MACEYQRRRIEAGFSPGEKCVLWIGSDKNKLTLTNNHSVKKNVFSLFVSGAAVVLIMDAYVQHSEYLTSKSKMARNEQCYQSFLREIEAIATENISIFYDKDDMWV